MPSQAGDSVYLVLWYRQDDKTPIYSYDSRLGAPELWSEPSVFGQRAVFRDYNGAKPAVLDIKEVTKEHDEGIIVPPPTLVLSRVEHGRVRNSC